MLRMVLRFNAVIPLARPTPSMAPTIVWVVETGVSKPGSDDNRSLKLRTERRNHGSGVNCVMPVHRCSLHDFVAMHRRRPRTIAPCHPATIHPGMVAYPLANVPRSSRLEQRLLPQDLLHCGQRHRLTREHRPYLPHCMTERIPNFFPHMPFSCFSRSQTFCAL